MSKLSRMLRGKLQSFSQRRGYHLGRQGDVHFLEPLLHAYLRRNGDVFFIQIGANDGRMADPVYQFVTLNHARVRGIVVEPVPDYFEQLTSAYVKYPGITPVNAAIHNSEKEMTLYRVDPARLGSLPRWAKGIASFDPKHHERSGIPADAIVSETVRCVTFGELLDAHRVERIDLLQIDTEGYDAEILRGIDFDAIRPNIVRFEHGLAEGIMSRDTFAELADRLHGVGYELVVEPHDATAYRRDALVDVK